MPEPVLLDIVAASEEEPLVLAGPPGALAARVELHNRSDATVVLRDAGLTDPSGALTLGPARHALPTVVLRPAQGRVVELTVAVDPRTPPGKYRAELDLGGRARPAVLLVAEVFALSVQPATIVVLNRAGRAQRKRVIVTNEGNVPFTIGDIGEVDLKDDRVWDRALRLAVEPWIRREDFDIEELVVAVLRVAREEAFRVGAVTVRSVAGGVEVAPGATVPIDLAITLREELPHNSRYRGRAPLLTEDLEIVVVSAREPVEVEPSATPARRVAKRPGKKATSTSRKTPQRRGGGR